jgi:hypothetical protein
MKGKMFRKQGELAMNEFTLKSNKILNRENFIVNQKRLKKTGQPVNL